MKWDLYGWNKPICYGDLTNTFLTSLKYTKGLELGIPGLQVLKDKVSHVHAVVLD